ncbi:hypothetical protein [Lentzea flaviverrucosa]|jgi:hypothetical protein|uniref:Secreted protein n=1 Tax=Lentzea flaviverrucosa TaxID=200379 RepID=A0A1H9XX14_9PSEU|nr:hypothetical protein [Lentzea flaviverrucosa]RDI17427.1 hypothetical protein DFR72_12158 [Lentzea flaviverrucosa]SES50705.1 hypothetical protein SAMN05216195_121130 [Lentzea flaviverrucosa]
MSTGAIIGLVVAVLVVLVVLAFVLRPAMQRKKLRDRFGPEYDRAVTESDSRTAAEKELAEREHRHSEFDLKPLSQTAQESYRRHWANVQAKFVDSPESAIADADRLVTDLMAERGYPTEGYEAQLSVLSVEHAKTLEHYRKAHDISERQEIGEASTEDLRTAMVHYRELFTDLLEHGTEPRKNRETVRKEKTDV